MKIFNLTYNELVKQFKKPSIKIIFSIILITAMILPIGISKIPKDIYQGNALESNKFMLEQEESNMNYYKNDKTQKGKILYKYASIDKEYRQLYVDNKIGFEDWREEEANYFKDTAYELAAIEFVLEGYEKDIVMENLRGVDPKKVESYYEMNLAKKKQVEAGFIAKKDQHVKNILNNDYMAHTQERINRQIEYIEDRKNNIKEYEKLKAKKPSNEEEKAKLEQLEKEVIEDKKSIEEFEQQIQIMKFRLDNKIDYDLNNWKNNSIQTIEDELSELRMRLLTEEEYSSQAIQQGYSMTYDEYVKNYNEKRDKRISKIKEVWYGLENNIPDINDITDARSVLDGTYEIYIILAVIMVIIIGGGIVATEFSKGTVRLLLIRPVSRWKVLLSKLLAVLAVGFSIVILGIGILYISTGAVFGFETYKTPLLETVNGAIVQVDYIKYLLPKIILSCSSLVFITAVVFSISTLAKNTALAVAIGMVLYLGTAPATDLLIGMKQTWIINTFIPYINASYFRLVPMTAQTLENGFGLQLQYKLGAIQLVVVSIILLAITFITFMKKDVKN